MMSGMIVEDRSRSGDQAPAHEDETYLNTGQGSLDPLGDGP